MAGRTYALMAVLVLLLAVVSVPGAPGLYSRGPAVAPGPNDAMQNAPRGPSNEDGRAGASMAVPDRSVMPTASLSEIKEESVRALFDEHGRLVTPDDRLARIAEKHEGGFGGFYFHETDRGHAFVYMQDPNQVASARAAFREAYQGGSRTITRITPVQGDYAFNDLLRWYRILGPALVENGIHPTTGSVMELKNRIHFGMSNAADIEEARRITRELGIPEGAVVFEVRILRLLSGTGGVKTWWRNFVGGFRRVIVNLTNDGETEK